jgi:hypothetical protein
MLHKTFTKQYFDLLRAWKTDGILWRGINMYSGQNCYTESENIKMFRML